MSDRPRVKQVVILEGDLVKTRVIRKNAAPAKYAPLLQDVFMLEGREALRLVGMRWFHGFTVKEV